MLPRLVWWLIGLACNALFDLCISRVLTDADAGSDAASLEGVNPFDLAEPTTSEEGGGGSSNDSDSALASSDFGEWAHPA